MYPANITRAEAERRSQGLTVQSYEVLVDLSGRVADAEDAGTGETFVSRSKIVFTGEDAVDTYLNLIADRLISATLDGEPLEIYADHKLYFATGPGRHEIEAWSHRYPATPDRLEEWDGGLRLVEHADDQDHARALADQAALAADAEAHQAEDAAAEAEFRAAHYDDRAEGC